jgi:hypothetical protein
MAERTILSGDGEWVSEERLKLFNATPQVWKHARDAGSNYSVPPVLESEAGMNPTVANGAGWVDFYTISEWSLDMVDFANALTKGTSLAEAGKSVVFDFGAGFDEPWYILAVSRMLAASGQNGTLTATFTRTIPAYKATIALA